MLFDAVKTYIDENILHSEPFDDVSESVQRKAVNNAEKVLYSIYKRFNASTNPLPIDAVAYQALFLLAKDDTGKRVENGATSISFNGVSMSFSQTYRTVSPDVIRILGRRTGSYGLHVSDTNRGMYFNDLQ